MDAKQIVASIGKPATTEAGLVVPAHSITPDAPKERKKVRLLYDTWKMIRRGMEKASGEKIFLLPTCSECKSLITVVVTDPVAKLDPDDRKMVGKMALRCDCTDREIVRGL